jgi:hypothetical protein
MRGCSRKELDSRRVPQPAESCRQRRAIDDEDDLDFRNPRLRDRRHHSLDLCPHRNHPRMNGDGLPDRSGL